MRLTALLAGEDLGAVRERAEAILAGLDRPAGDSAFAGALVALSFISWRKGQVDDPLGLLRAGVQRSDRRPVEGRRVYPRLYLADRLVALEQFDEAERAICAGV